ncbi:MFS transporter [Granulosicoccus sp.]|nr:MFS transporter [Granulosicoccus sp.]MDB4224635.1 MFS transporter [Granulosicoccus sp.]
MPNSNSVTIIPFLCLLFFGTVCSAMIVPFIGYFLVEGLGQEPWIISFYSLLAVGLTLIANRSIGRRIDEGAYVFPLVGFAALGFMFATLALCLSPSLWTVMTFGVVGFGFSTSAVSTMFSLGGSLAELYNIERSRFNAYMRATSSTAWMIGPAIAFMLADRISVVSVFFAAFGMSLVWICLWWLVLPRDITASKPNLSVKQDIANASQKLWWAAAFVFSLSFAHSLTFSSLPLFYVREVGLPGFSPGIAFSVKTFVEVFAVFSTPRIIARFGMRNALLATTLLAVATIQFLANVESFPQMVVGAAMEGLYYGIYASIGISYIQSFAEDRPARATALYWNVLMVSGLLAGPAVGFIAQVSNFQTVVNIASGVAFFALGVLIYGSRGRLSV